MLTPIQYELLVKTIDALRRPGNWTANNLFNEKSITSGDSESPQDFTANFMAGVC
jgi:hypothetical protein